MSGSSQVTCLAWVKRGVAKETPDKVELSQDQLKKLFQDAKTGLQEVGDDEDEGIQEEEVDDDEDGGGGGGGGGDADGEGGDGSTPAAVDAEINDGDEDELAKYGLDKYDEEDDVPVPMDDSEGQATGSGIGMISSTLPSLAMYASNDDDPYVTIKDDEDEDEYEKEDFTIKPTDNLVVVGKVHEDYGNLEIHVYNEEEGACYIHHDILLPAFPLALEWLTFDPGEGAPGNLVAVGSMVPTIDVWDLDLVDCLEPAFTLGVPKSKLRKKSANFLGHQDAVLDLSWNRHLQHVLASASADHTIALWDMEEGTAASVIRKHTDKVQSIQWHPFEAQSLLSGGFDKTVKVYDCRSPDDNLKSWLTEGEVERVLWNHFQPFTFLASTDTGFVCCYDIRSTSDPVFRLKAHNDAVTGLSLSNKAPGCLVTGSADHTYKIWDIQDNKPSLIVSKDPKMKAVHCIHSNPDSAFVMAMGGEQDGLRVVDVMSHAPVSNQFGARPQHTIPEPEVTANTEVLPRTQSGQATNTDKAGPSGSNSQKKARRKKKKKVPKPSN